MPDYSIHIPAWVTLSQHELCSKTTTWDQSNIAWWSYKLYEERFDKTADYDEYINKLFAPVESNIIDAVKAARRQWLEKSHTGRFHREAKILHDWSGWAAFETVRSAYHTAGASGRQCNRPPRMGALNPAANGLSVTFHAKVQDPDGEGIAQVLVGFWRWVGDHQLHP